MENEVYSVTKIGVALIMLAVALGIGFLVLGATSNSAFATTEHIESRQEKLINEAREKFDNNIISGADVLDVIVQYADSGLALLVYTTDFGNALYKEQSGYGTLESQMNGGKGAYTMDGNNVPIVHMCKTASAVQSSTGKSTVTSPSKVYSADGHQVSLKFVNYGAILGSSTAGSTGCIGYSYTYGSTRVYAAIGYIDSDNRVVVNTSGITSPGTNKFLSNGTYQNIAIEGRSECVISSANFDAMLVTDSVGNLLGLAFIQQVLG